MSSIIRNCTVWDARHACGKESTCTDVLVTYVQLCTVYCLHAMVTLVALPATKPNQLLLTVNNLQQSCSLQMQHVSKLNQQQCY